MEEVLLVEQEKIYVPEMRLFREFVDNQSEHWKKRDEIYIKTNYLLASRPSELLSKVVPSHIKRHMSNPYGKLLTSDIVSYKKPDGKVVPILLVHSAIAKKFKTQKKKQQETSPQPSPQPTIPESIKVQMKDVPIVCDLAAEPWSLDLLHWIQKNNLNKKSLSFNIVEMTCQNIIRKCLHQLDPTASPKSLRHWRVSHLRRNYGFDGIELTAFTGWSLSNTYGQLGQKVSPMIDVYCHTSWLDYVQKLLVPLSEVL